jgi:hypothetical protein
MDKVGQIESVPLNPDEDLQKYKDWFQKSLEITGKLDLPNKEAFNKRT